MKHHVFIVEDPTVPVKVFRWRFLAWLYSLKLGLHHFPCRVTIASLPDKS